MQFLEDHEFVEDEQAFCVPVQESVNCFLGDAEIIDDDSRKFRLSAEQSVQLDYDRMRRRLTYYFMNPIEKWHEKKRFPWKLCLQVIKIIFVTWQIILFGLRSHGFVQQHRDATIALSQIFLLDWVHDFTVYPPSSGPYAVYTIPDFYKNMDNVVKQYSRIPTLALGSFSFDMDNGSIPLVELCTSHYRSSGSHLFTTKTFVSSYVEKKCFHLPLADDQFSVEEFLNSSNHRINFNTLVKAEIKFPLKTVILKTLSKLDVPDCYNLRIRITYDNKPHDGQIKIKLVISSKRFVCEFNVEFLENNEKTNYVLRQMLNSIVIILCALSVILCIRSLRSGMKLSCEAAEFFCKYYNRILPMSEYLDFVDFWYVMIVVSDTLIISASIIKLKIEENAAHEGNLYMQCSLLLGIGNLLVWVGLLRYLGFFKKYNMLILTLKRALPNVLRFLLCAILLYSGFCFCGWIVLGPYHIKFQSLSRTSECLFSVLNGDDMFATFALTDSDNLLIWWFSRVYLYVFLVLFIYVVVSLFISVIMDTFETIKRIYVHGTPPETTVELFLSHALSAPEAPLIEPSASNHRNESSEPEPKAITVIKALFTELRKQLQRQNSVS